MKLHRDAWMLAIWIAGCFACATAAGEEAMPSVSMPARADGHDPLSPFSAQEIREFLVSTTVAAKIEDPMQRCLNYPDPPGSHWSREGIAVYCRYRLQPVINLAEMKALIDSGRAAEIDRRLDEWTSDKAGHPEAFWRMFSEDFHQTGDDIRTLLEAWKQQSPDSAYAYAASGYNFYFEASAARGSQYIKDTPEASIEAMATFLDRADGDLRRAIKLNPSLALPYAALISIGGMAGNRAYVNDAVRKVWEIDPASLPVYDALSMATMPRWGGSLSEQTQLKDQALLHANRNPLLYMVQAKVLMDQADLLKCYCRTAEDRAGYRAVFDQVSSRGELSDAGSNALSNGHYELAVVYLSEAVRFGDAADGSIGKDLKEALAHIDPALISPEKASEPTDAAGKAY